ncbi:MAG: Dam family site-specific DNA-(adenine-N6)-methyltransferase [Anaerolineae bacterium]|nr:Dam family site-specific DNA-(adenine-N6)-methyltransferase [Anaerolineae bacterium]MCO5193383.1 Dam family site-specific DNA-(adenine-N6)-methyltransferase [Anaerolineae bacterium]MCO5198779.1 Dam family site-specific DNA-(adenine-N6)-methyltransferase [Anaerolineae bacterium]MCO5207901.1 Dam family site-specific DNA-(adenine-N6)-methyltransferase [Anaerolineae bacterium]
MKVHVPPIKSQGIKTKLVLWIRSLVPPEFSGIWIEPFMGTGVVGFNLAGQRALLCDTNPHLIDFYTAISEKRITPGVVRKYLEEEGAQLRIVGESHYYSIRDRFNKQHNPLDFLFLSRASFNGMIRFNQKGRYNVPFCRKPNRFSPAYVTKIVNQVEYVSNVILTKDITFSCQGFEKTIDLATHNDIIYCDPPYIGRHADYYNGWDDTYERNLFQSLSASPGKFILSTWHHNDYRANEYIDLLWSQFNIITHEHFYHVGANERNRNPMVEAIVTNIDLSAFEFVEPVKPVQLQLFEERAGFDS